MFTFSVVVVTIFFTLRMRELFIHSAYKFKLLNSYVWASVECKEDIKEVVESKMYLQ